VFREVEKVVKRKRTLGGWRVIEVGAESTNGQLERANVTRRRQTYDAAVRSERGDAINLGGTSTTLESTITRSVI
jgi:hypothetical protein